MATLEDNVLVTIVAEANSDRPAAQFAGMLLDMLNKEGGFESD